MTGAVTLSACHWGLVPRSVVDGSAGAGGQAFHAGAWDRMAGPQFIHYVPATWREGPALLEALKPLAAAHPGGFPTVQDARAALAYLPRPAEAFTLEEDGQRWWLRNTSTVHGGDPFAHRDWQVVIRGRRGWVCHPLAAKDVCAALGLFPLLDGTRPLQAVRAALADNAPALALLTTLFRQGLVVPATPVSTRDWPTVVSLGHAGLALRADDGWVLVDPVQPVPEGHQARAVLITHHHWDHFHYQTLCHLPRHVPVVVPGVASPSLADPPMASYLRALGFTEVRQVAPWEAMTFGPLGITFAPYVGEPCGLGSRFSGFTTLVEAEGWRLYGAVDACHDESGTMDPVMEQVARRGAVDFFLSGYNGIIHRLPFFAAGFRHFSNELLTRPDLIRYLPSVDDVMRWLDLLLPRYVVPYAAFNLRGGEPPPDIASPAQANGSFEAAWRGPRHLRSRYRHSPLGRLAQRPGVTLLTLGTMQGFWPEHL